MYSLTGTSSPKSVMWRIADLSRTFRHFRDVPNTGSRLSRIVGLGRPATTARRSPAPDCGKLSFRDRETELAIAEANMKYTGEG